MAAGSSATTATNSNSRNIPAAARTSLDDINTRPAQIDTRPGEYWLVSKDGEQDWPVVICDEEIVQKYFKGPRPENASVVDGTWPELFQPGGDLRQSFCFPILYLGTLELGWSSWKRLKQLDFQLAVAIRDTTPNKKLKEAYHDAILMFEWNRLPYWKDKLCAMKLADESAPVQHTGNKRKRKSTPDPKPGPVFKWPPGFGPDYGGDNVDDEEPEYFMTGRDGKRRMIKKETSDTTTLAASKMVSDESKGNDLFRSQEGKNKAKAPGRLLSSLAAPVTSSKSDKPDSLANGKYVAEHATVDLDKVVIYIGNPHKEFTINKAGIDDSPLLARLMSFDDKIGFYVMAPVLSSLSPLDFEPVAQYLDRGDYHPDLLNRDTKSPSLEDIDSFDDRAYQLLRCGTIYSIAHKVELPELQSLAIRKLKVLQPYPAFEFLKVVGMIMHNGKSDVEGLRPFVVQYLAEHYSELVKEETQKMIEITDGNARLAGELFHKLSDMRKSKSGRDGETVGEEEPRMEADVASFRVYDEV